MQNNNYTNWNLTCNRFVVYLDLMGFTDTVNRKTHKEIYEKFLFINKLINLSHFYLECSEEKNEWFYTSQFSDSIIIISSDDSSISLSLIAVIMQQFIYELIMEGISLKGACAHGEITVDAEKSIFFGQPIIDAYELEKDIHYYGIVCHNSFEKHIIDNTIIDNVIDNKLVTKSYWEKHFFYSKTKLKSGDIEHANVNWFLHNEDTNEQIYNNVNEVLKKIRLQVSGKPRIYIDNTLEMANRALKIKNNLI